MTNNYFGHGSRSAVDIEPTSKLTTIQNITIQSNTWGPNPNYWFSNIGVGATIKSVHFLNNTLARTMAVDSVDPSSTINRSDYEFVGNVSSVKQAVGNCENGGGETMRIVGVSSLTIHSNTQRMETPTNNTCQSWSTARTSTGRRSRRTTCRTPGRSDPGLDQQASVRGQQLHWAQQPTKTARSARPSPGDALPGLPALMRHTGPRRIRPHKPL